MTGDDLAARVHRKLMRIETVLVLLLLTVGVNLGLVLVIVTGVS